VNGHKARQIRGLAWQAHADAAVATGQRRYLTDGRSLRQTARRIRRHYTRTSRLPVIVR
jgi:hypothetical protein